MRHPTGCRPGRVARPARYHSAQAHAACRTRASGIRCYRLILRAECSADFSAKALICLEPSLDFAQVGLRGGLGPKSSQRAQELRRVLCLRAAVTKTPTCYGTLRGRDRGCSHLISRWSHEISAKSDCAPRRGNPTSQGSSLLTTPEIRSSRSLDTHAVDDESRHKERSGLSPRCMWM